MANPDWKPGMESPNPAGRPPGIVDKRMRVSQALADSGEAVAKVAVDAALAGDTTAMGLVLSRVYPSLKSDGERVEFTFSPGASPTDQANAVMAAVAEGRITVENGKALLDMLSALVGFRDVDTFLAELKRLRESKRGQIPGGVKTT